jgi:hypothetical protein
MSEQLDNTERNHDLEAENYLLTAVQEAENIVDEVFSELDDLLDERDFEPVIEQNQEDIKQKDEQLPLALEAELLSDIIPQREEVIEQKYFDSTAFAEQEVLQETTPKLIKHFDKLLFLSSFSFLVGVITWLVSIEKLKFPVFVQTNSSIIAEVNPPSPNQEFASYLLQSLKIIEQEKSLAVAIPPTNDREIEEKIPASNNSTPVNSPTRIVERIYIPFYQPAPTPPPTSQPTAQPTANNQIAAQPPQNNTQPVAQKPVAQTTPQPITTPPPPPILQETPSPPPLTENKLDEQPTQMANAGGDRHTVLGLIELGDRSAALLEINGITRRIYVGESIGQSGWNLEAVGNDQVKISRNGQRRSLSVGQEF